MAVHTQFAFRTLKGIGIVNAAPSYSPLPGFQRPEGSSRCCTYSPDGRFFAWASVESVIVVDASEGHVVTNLPIPNVYELGFSPRGSYLITWERPSKDENGDAVKNLKVWRTVEHGSAGEEKKVVGRFVQKSQTGWNLQYTYDERYCARVVTNEVQFYESSDLGTVWNKLRAEGVADFAVSPGNNHTVAIFVPERKNQPAAVKVYNVPDFAAPVSQKNFFKGDKVELKWNKLGTTLLVLAQTEVDKTGKSYYGETTLYVLSASGGFDSRITLDKDGPIHSVCWSPNSKEFGVVYGYMPAKTTIFNQKAVATYTFPLGPRNTIDFSPSGRLVLVAGFGNLAGQMDIYDLEKDYRKVCTIEGGNPSLCEWSPDGRYILTATTSPRLRVDNGIRLWHVGGSIMYNEDMTELYHVTWRPQTLDSFPRTDPLQPVPTPHASAVAYLGTVKTPSKPAGAYRPPGARGTSTPLHFKREDEGGAAHIVSNGTSLVNSIAFGKPRRQIPGAEAVDNGVSTVSSVPGAAAVEDENLSKTALKNKKKREAKKAKEAEVKASPSDASPPTADGLDQRQQVQNPQNGAGSPLIQKHRNDAQALRPSRQGQPNHNNHENVNVVASGSPGVQEGVPLPADDAANSGSATNTPAAKKLRALQKKVRAIEDLEMRLAGGEKLETTQMRKIGTKAQVLAELESLGNDH